MSPPIERPVLGPRMISGCSAWNFRKGIGCCMWMSECLIVVDRNNADANTLKDIAAALGDIGAVMTDSDNDLVIQATLPAHEVPVVAAITGVSYVRCVFNFFCGDQPRRAA